MAKKITLASLAADMRKGFAALTTRMEQGFAASDKKFAALAEDMTDMRRELKSDIGAVQQQVNSIETQLRGMKHDKLETRVTKLEEQVFGPHRR
jgi:hypothetical protein